MGDQRRKLGFDALSDIAWGTHLCLFYETPEYLAEILALYFKAGLENNEFCMWVTSGPSESQEARAASKKVVSDLDSYIGKGQIEILDAAHWYTRSGQSEADKTLQGLVEKEQQAIKRGFEGLRLSENMFWLEETDWQHIVEHEATVNDIIGKHRMIVICSYPIARYEIAKVLGVANSHQLALVRRADKWVAIESEERFRSLVETINDWIWETDANGTYTYTGPRVKELLGYEPHEVIGKTPFDFMPPEEAKRVADEFMVVVKSGKPFAGLESLKLRKDGQAVILETSGVPIFNSDGELRGYRGIDRDITKRKRVEEALRKSEAEYRLLVENANEAIAVACDGMLRFVNPKAAELTGYSREELTSRPFVDFIHPDDREMVVERHMRRLRGEQVPEVYPFRVIDKDGNTKWLEISAVLISWENRPATLNFLNDITERRKAEEEVKRSRAELRRLSAHLQSVMERERKRIAHEIHDELGQQLTALKMDLSWIGKNLPKNKEPLLEKIGAMSKCIDTTIETVRRISTYLRPAILDDFGLLAAIEWQLTEFQRRTGIKCKIVPQSNDVVLEQTQAVALFRIFQEALTNVARHANAMGIEVSLKEKDSRVLLQIKDNGRGIREEEITSSRSIGIVGMRERARLCGGQMRIKGIPGKGTTVKVSIPLKEEELSAEDTHS